MALRGGFRFEVKHDDVFPMGAMLLAEPTPKVAFTGGKSTDEQEIDKVTNLPVWTVQVLDLDPSVNTRNKVISVRLMAKSLPKVEMTSPMMPVRFSKLYVTPYMPDGGRFLSYSYRAEGLEVGTAA